MRTLYTINQMKQKVKEWKRQGLTIGFVPTMGYLHEGHASLIRKASSECDRVVVSTFVNPIQFGPNEDLDKYPRDQERDEEVCIKNGADVMFFPSVLEMYGEDRKTTVSVIGLTAGLCGAKRPGHFDGVTTILTKLFNIITPKKAYFGEKDIQQLMVVKKMVKDLNMDVKIIGCPIVREEDGLAKSSRNKYLNQEERKAALVLSKSLNKAREYIINNKNKEILATEVKEIIAKEISTEDLAKIDYIEIVDKENIAEVNMIKDEILVAIAVYIGKIRLIDNFIL
ncbi:pantothenate synthetase [Clostridium cavendishii DSM 21758]|uniref:Pantothenate synthetase n=1 Tax=Clostridium cavendishii DSM 21758 TaxID=1121302 RepID=A0A1M6EX12_9CLOT|nr:pantoate--beta-alanine ligase [Clostridium cavendishii]SHI89972.1 pantothenate synthetase [Clostridium cavendishii DSM 21758]